MKNTPPTSESNSAKKALAKAAATGKKTAPARAKSSSRKFMVVEEHPLAMLVAAAEHSGKKLTAAAKKTGSKPPLLGGVFALVALQPALVKKIIAELRKRGWDEIDKGEASVVGDFFGQLPAEDQDEQVGKFLAAMAKYLQRPVFVAKAKLIAGAYDTVRILGLSL